MIKQWAFVIGDIHVDSIREIEKIISDSSRSKISEFDLWIKIDGKQDVKVYLRSLWRIIEYFGDASWISDIERRRAMQDSP